MNKKEAMEQIRICKETGAGTKDLCKSLMLEYGADKLEEEFAAAFLSTQLTALTMDAVKKLKLSPSENWFFSAVMTVGVLGPKEARKMVLKAINEFFDSIDTMSQA